MKKQNAPVIVALMAALSVSLLLSPGASAGTNAWSAESIPGLADNVLGPTGLDVRDMAVAGDGKTIYAVPGDSLSGDIVYKSTNSGEHWAGISVSVQADLVAVSPDDAGLVAFANSGSPAVYVSTDGGSNWSSLGTPQQSGGNPAAAIHDIAISAASSGVHFVAVAGEEAGNIANAWYFQVGSAAPSWQETRNMPGFGSANLVQAVAFSPDFPSDKIMVAVSEKDSVSVDLQVLSLSDYQWNAAASFAGYPVAIVADSGISGLGSASLSLAPDYSGGDSATRDAFVGLTVSGAAAARAASGIYFLDDNSRKALETGVDIHSIDFDGSRLVAGQYDSNDVYRSANPMASVPTVSSSSTLKKPGGENRTVVAWSGGDVAAGTSGNESSFAVSQDSGETFNDIALIDTVIVNARDVAVSASGGMVYLVTDDGADLSLWRQATSWERVLSRPATTGYIVRISPDDPNVVYLAKEGAATIYYSGDGGEATWLTRTCNVNVQDLAVESDDVLYALDSEGEVSRSTSAGFTWGTVAPTGLDSGTGHMIASVSHNNLLVGSSNGYAAYSTNGNSSWTKIPRVLQQGAGNVQLVADAGFASNRVIYAASDEAGQNIKKWVIGSSTDWEDVFLGTIKGGVYGLAVNSGALYALEYNPTTGQSALWICLAPTSATASSSSWSSGATTATTDADDATVHLNAVPQALRASSAGKMWAVKTNGTNKLYSFGAILAELVLSSPEGGVTYPLNAITGVPDEIVFSWNRPDTVATSYEMDIAYDPGFDGVITTITINSSEATVVVRIGPRAEGDARMSFTPGAIYYWRVRVTQPLYSLYSGGRGFTIEPMPAMVPSLLTPQNGATGVSRTPSFSWEPVSGTTGYRFVLADNANLVSPMIDVTVNAAGFAAPAELDYGRAYYWAVKSLAPAEGSWSAVANFRVRQEPVATTPPVVIEQLPAPVITLPAPPPQQEIVISPPSPAPEPIVPAYIWAAVIIGTVLVVAVTLLILQTYRKKAPRGSEPTK